MGASHRLARGKRAVSGWHHRSGIEGRFIIGDSETLEGWQLW